MLHILAIGWRLDRRNDLGRPTLCVVMVGSAPCAPQKARVALDSAAVLRTLAIAICLASLHCGFRYDTVRSVTFHAHRSQVKLAIGIETRVEIGPNVRPTAELQ